MKWKWWVDGMQTSNKIMHMQQQQQGSRQPKHIPTQKAIVQHKSSPTRQFPLSLTNVSSPQGPTFPLIDQGFPFSHPQPCVNVSHMHLLIPLITTHASPLSQVHPLTPASPHPPHSPPYSKSLDTLPLPTTSPWVPHHHVGHPHLPLPLGDCQQDPCQCQNQQSQMPMLPPEVFCSVYMM